MSSESICCNGRLSRRRWLSVDVDGFTLAFVDGCLRTAEGQLFVKKIIQLSHTDALAIRALFSMWEGMSRVDGPAEG